MKNTSTTVCLLTLFLFSTPVYSQNIRDNWQEMPATSKYFECVMKMKSPSEAQFDTLWNVVQQYSASNADTCLLLTQHAVEITKNHKIKRLYGEALYLHGKAVIEKDPASGLNLILSAREILKNEKYFDTYSVVEGFLGLHYARNNQFEKAIEHQLNALEIAKAQKDTTNFVRPLMAIGGIYFKLGSLSKAQEYISEAVKMLEASHGEELLPTALSNQAMIFQQIGKRFNGVADTSGTSAGLYRDSAVMNYNLGLNVANKGLLLAQKQAVPTTILTLLNTITSLKNSLQDYKSAVIIGKDAMQMAEKLKIPFFLVNSHMNLSAALRNLGNYSEALLHAKAGYEIVEKDVRAGNIEIFEMELIKIYKATGRADLALPIMEKAMSRLRDNNLLATKKAITEAETKYQTAEKEKQILEMAITNEKISKQRNYILGGGLFLGILGFWGFRFNKVQKDRNDRKAFAEALIFAQEEERKRIGRDLHDGIGQSLLLIKKQMDNNIGISLENQQMISSTLEEVRAISHNLHPFQLDKFGITATINDMVLKIEQSTDLFITREIDDIDKVLDSKSEIHLYRAIQEALSNIIKHAEATAAKIIIKNMADKIMISILDNGLGFDMELTVATSKSLGIRTMYERISAIGGKLKIEKGETSGMQIHISIPKTKHHS